MQNNFNRKFKPSIAMTHHNTNKKQFNKSYDFKHDLSNLPEVAMSIIINSDKFSVIKAEKASDYLDLLLDYAIYELKKSKGKNDGGSEINQNYRR
jgi:hypothetical protein